MISLQFLGKFEGTYAPDCCLDELKSKLVLIRGVDQEEGSIAERRNAGLAAPS
jgi:hypothetical protein